MGDLLRNLAWNLRTDGVLFVSGKVWIVIYALKYVTK